MRHHRHLLAFSILYTLLLTGIGCASRKPGPELTDRPASGVVAEDYLSMVRIDPDMFQAPPGQIRVFTTSRPALDAARSRGSGDDFDNGASPLFYMGSEADWDYYYLANHAFGLFYRVSREYNPQADRMPLTGNSLVWREVKAGAPTTKP